MAGQLPAIPVEPLNAVNALLIAYIALGRPCPRLAGMGAGRRAPLGARARRSRYAGLLASVRPGLGSRRRGAAGSASGRAPRSPRPAPRSPCSSPSPRRGRLAGVHRAAAGPRGQRPRRRPGRRDPLRARRPRRRARRRRASGSRAARDAPRRGGRAPRPLIVLTHDSLDHAGGRARRPRGDARGRARLRDREPRDARGGARAPARGSSTSPPGSVMRAGALRLEVLWPPPELVDAPRRRRPGARRRRAQQPRRRRARPLAGVLDAAHRRRRGRGRPAAARARRRPQGRPPRQRRRGPRRAARPQRPAARGDRGRRGQPLRPSDPATLAELAAHGVPVLRTDLDGRFRSRSPRVGGACCPELSRVATSSTEGASMRRPRNRS